MELFYSIQVKVEGQRSRVRFASTDLKGMRVGDQVKCPSGAIGIVQKITKSEGFSLNIPRAETPVQCETGNLDG
jgi:preprotein translocase subunit YajC